MIPLHIIGGGFSGTMVLYHLMQHDDLPPLDISFHDHAGAHGRGFAYNTLFDEHLLNVPAAGMSALPDKADDFISFLPAGSPPQEFYPRRIYGDYLTTLLQKSLELAAQKKHRIQLLQDTASPAGEITVYATGAALPSWPLASDFKGAIYVSHPYREDFRNLLSAMENIREVIVLGTGLSAVDAILSLDKAGYAGQITAVSRRGFWPMPHGPKKHFWQWRKYIDALRPHSNKIWRGLPEFLRLFLLKRLTYWNIVRHRMPPQCHAVIQRLEKSGQLRRLKMDIKTLIGSRDFADCAVINCLGYIQPYQKSRFSDDGLIFALGPPLFGYYIETTAVPELKMQARETAEKIAALVKKRQLEK